MNNLAERKINIRFKPQTFRVQAIWVSLAVCVCIILGTYNVGFSYIAFLLSILSLFVLSQEDALAFMFFLMPFASIFKNTPGGTSFYTYLIFFYIAYNMLVHPTINKKFFVCFVLLGSFIVAQMLISINLSRMIKFMTNFLFIYYALNANVKKDGKKIFLYYIFAFILASLVSVSNIIPTLDEYIVIKALGGTQKTVIRFAGLYEDPNHYSINIIICLCLLVILNHKKYLGNISSSVLALILLYFAIMTISKSAFLMLLLPLLMLLYSRIKKRKYFIFAFLLIVVIVFFAALVEGRIGVFDTILSRFRQDEDVSDLTTGRIDLWQSYIKYFFKNIGHAIFGGGLNAKLLGGFLMSEKVYVMAPHNTYIDMIYYLGCVGTFFLILTLKALSEYKMKKFKRNFLNYSVWICVAIMYAFLSKLFYFDWPFHIILAVLVNNINFAVE